MRKNRAKDTGVRLVVPHIKECAYSNGLNGTDPHVFHCLAGDFDWRTIHGMETIRGRTYLWHRFRCTDTHCHAIAVVRADKISELISKALR